MLSTIDGLVWLLVSLASLAMAQRSLHREIQAFFLILTRRPGVTQTIFSLVFLPGVCLHELSHYLMAKLLRVRTGRISLIPMVQSDGRLRLGYVETASGGFLKDTLIGLAPLVTGSLFVALIAIHKMQLLPLWDNIQTSDWLGIQLEFGKAFLTPDFWLWFYLAFIISSMMMPSASDRQAWLPVVLLGLGMVGLAVLAGAGNWMLDNLAPPVNVLLRTLALIFGLSTVLHIILFFPFWMLHNIIARITKIDIG